MCPAADPCWLCSCVVTDDAESTGSNDEELSEEDYSWEEQSAHQTTPEVPNYTGMVNRSSLYCTERLTCMDW